MKKAIISLEPPSPPEQMWQPCSSLMPRGSYWCTSKECRQRTWSSCLTFARVTTTNTTTTGRLRPPSTTLIMHFYNGRANDDSDRYLVSRFIGVMDGRIRQTANSLTKYLSLTILTP